MGFYYAGINSKDYWRERLFDEEHRQSKTEDVVINQLNIIYNRTFRDITNELNTFYNIYATDNGLTWQQVQKRLTPIEMRDYKEHMRNLEAVFRETQDPNILRDINALKARAQVTRYEKLLDAIDAKLIEITNNVQITLEDHLIGAYTRSYQSALELVGINSKSVVNNRAIEFVIRYPFCGAMFSDRIWRNKRQLLNCINDDLTKGLVRGDSIQKMGKSLKERCRVAKFQSERLVRTESMNCMTRGTLDGYEDSKVVDAIEIINTGDNRMCSICSTKGGEVIPLNEAITGDSVPPFHPNCRCCVAPVIIEVGKKYKG